MDLTAGVDSVDWILLVRSRAAPVAVVDEGHQGEEGAVRLGIQHIVHLIIKPRSYLQGDICDIFLLYEFLNYQANFFECLLNVVFFMSTLFQLARSRSGVS